MTDVLSGLALVLVLSIAARLLASYLRIPAIVPLLIAGGVAGGVTGLIDPSELLGDALSPVISIAVGIILFEGALGLRWADLSGGVRNVVVRIITIGVIVTWVGTTLAVLALFDLSTGVSILIGAILIVSGPTVVIPMLDFIRPSGPVRSALRWEGILVDPIGAIIAVLVFGALDFSSHGMEFRVGEFAAALITGGAIGGAGAFALRPLLASQRFSGRDKVAASLMMVVAAFAAADLIYEDAGLVATIVTGLILANQRRVDIARVAEFSETLVPLLIGVLFILLAASVDLGAVADLGLSGIALILVIVVLVRPAAVLLSTVRSRFTWRERAFLAAMAPKGIVAASTASVFGVQLVDSGVPGADQIVPISFLVIAGTVFIYALGAPPFARWLQVAQVSPPRILIVGAPGWALRLGRELAANGTEVLVWAQDEDEVRGVSEAGLTLAPDPLLGDEVIEGELIEGISAVLLVSRDDAFNSVLAELFTGRLDAAQVYVFPPQADSRLAMSTRATPLFDLPGGDSGIPERLLAGESIGSVKADEVRAGSLTVLAAIRFGKGNRPAAVRLTSPDTPAHRHPGDVYVVLDERR